MNMTKPIRLTVWKCGECGKTYQTEIGAIKCDCKKYEKVYTGKHFDVGIKW